MQHKVLLLLVALFAAGVLAESNSNAKVTLLVFSGTSNPSWELNTYQTIQLQQKIKSSGVNAIANANELNVDLGYQGFLVEFPEDSLFFHVFKNQDLEHFLMNSMLDNSHNLFEEQRMKGLLEHIFVTINNNGVQPKPQDASSIPTPHLKEIVRGPDNVTAFTPEKWNKNPQVQYNNNCYNYGNDVRTDTFAQPGRGTGHKWDLNTCDSVWDAAVRDGLLPYSKTKAPEWDEKPDVGHFIALAIWPNYNFHWYKKDITGYWSHKPGGTPCRDYDNSGKQIKDPAFADRGPYTIFCGYLISIPSKVNIN